MYMVMLALNAYTDLRQGVVYDVLSLGLFLAAFIETGFVWPHPLFFLLLLCLSLFRLWDKQEHYLGRGDDLILLASALKEGARWSYVLLATSLSLLMVMMFRKSRQEPLVPYLFLGTLLIHGALWVIASV